jgi:cytosine/adenosine deaminase-related metal-dependent hydrolase
MSNDTVTLTARYVFPVDGPPMERGLLDIGGDRIVGLRLRGRRAADFDFGNAAIVPGFVNAHTHLDLRGARGLTPPSADFIDWLGQVIAYRAGRSLPEVEQDIREGIADCVRSGTTLIGDIAHEGLSTDALLDAPLRSIVFRELIGLTFETVARTWEGFRWWLEAFPESKTCKPGVSPHAPYSASEYLFFMAAASNLPIATHLAESPHELELLERQTGPFAEFLRRLGVWEPDGLAPGLDRVIELCQRSRTPSFVHGNYLRPDAPISPAAGIVYCPRTHAAFGHPPHPFRDFLARGVRVAFGTDSLASNPDLDLLAEARFVHIRYPDILGETLLRMATLSGAEALGFADVTGTLSPGKSADFAIVDLPDRNAADPHELLFDSDLPVIATVFRGKCVLASDDDEPLPDLPLPSITLR